MLTNYIDIIDHIEKSTAWQHADYFSQLPEHYQVAISKMEIKLRGKSELKAMIRFKIAKDIEAIIAGEKIKLYCWEYLTDEEREYIQAFGTLNRVAHGEAFPVETLGAYNGKAIIS